jgi:hypothetical protein
MRGFVTFLVLVALCSAPAQQPCLAAQQASGQTAPADAAAPGGGKPGPQADPAPPAPGRPLGTFARPQNGVRHPDLDKAWAEYDSIVAKVTEDVAGSIKKEFQAAVTKGDLDAVEKWEGLAKKLASGGECQLEEELGFIGKRAALKLKSASAALEKAYDSVVKSLTMGQKLAEAKAVKSEFTSLTSTVQAAAKAKETEKAIEQSLAKFSGFWRGKDGIVEEFRADGTWSSQKDPSFSGTWVLDLQDPKGVCLVRTSSGRNGEVVRRYYVHPANPNVLRYEDGRTFTRE